MMLAADTHIHNRYRVVRHLAGGGMGHVYEAVDERFHSTVALKQMTLSGVAAERAFQREAQILNHLRHRALPRVTDYFSEDTGQFLVMDYIPGKDLGDLLAEHDQPFLVADVLTWLDELLDALSYLHSQDVIHRDIKPQNLKLDTDNHLILLDFGIAKNQTGSRSVHAFTPQFAPLEQIQNEGTDPRSDLYSVAATAYALLTNQQPPSSLTRFMEVTRQQPDPVAPLHTVNPQVPQAVSAVLMQAMALHAADRPADAVAMKHLLRQARQHPNTDPTLLASSAAFAATTRSHAQSAALARTQEQPPSHPPLPPTVVTGTPPPTQPPVTNAPHSTPWLLPALGGGVVVLVLILIGAALVLLPGATSENDSAAQQDRMKTTPAEDDPANGDEMNAIILPDEADDDADAAAIATSESSPDPEREPTTTPTSAADLDIEQTAAALDATASAVIALEQTAQARIESEARAGTTTALRQTEQAIATTAEALAAAQTAQPTSIPAPTVPAPSDLGRVCDQATVIGSIAELAIQETPFIDNTVLPGTAPHGATVDVLCVEPQTNDNRVWVWVAYAGIEGWMSTRYLRFAQGMPAGQCGIGTVVNIAALSIREETNRGSRYLGEVPAGQQVAVLCVPQIFDDGRSWAFVRYQGIEGWMSTNYLQIE